MDGIEAKKKGISSRLRSARDMAGLSQNQVAKKLMLHRPSVSEMESGKRNVSAPELAKLADIYGVSVSWLACENVDETDADRDRIEIAARKLSKLKKEDITRILDLFKSLTKK